MEARDRQRVRTVLVVATLAIVAGIAVFRIPLQSIFVLGVALVCPLLMAGMHAGHRHDHHEPDGIGHRRADPSTARHDAIGRIVEGHEEVDR